MNQENTIESKLTLTQKIQKLREIIAGLTDLENEENNYEAGNIAHLLKIMVELFVEVDQRLKELEKKQETK